MTVHEAGAENGMSALTAPLNALLGVFLGSLPPNLTPAPTEFLYRPDALVLMPGLKQVFFLGEGLTTAGGVQMIVVPPGATRFFLGVMDGFQWSNNVGSFIVSVIPVPTLTILPSGSSQAQLRWPTNAAGYSLEFATSLPAPAWTAVTNLPTIIGEQFSLTVETAVGSKFYRLRNP